MENNFELVLEKIEKRTKHKYPYMTHLFEVLLSTWVLTRKTSPHVFVFSYYSQHDVFSLISPTRGESGGIYTI